VIPVPGPVSKRPSSWPWAGPRRVDRRGHGHRQRPVIPIRCSPGGTLGSAVINFFGGVTTGLERSEVIALVVILLASRRW